MKTSKKILYSALALLLISGTAFSLSQRSELFGLFTPITHTTPEINRVAISTTIEEAASYAAGEETAAATAATATAADATNATTAYTTSNRNDLEAAQYAAVNDSNDAKTAASNAAAYLAQAQAFYDSAYDAWETSSQAVTNDAAAKALLILGYAGSQYTADIAHVKWDYALWMAWTFDTYCSKDSDGTWSCGSTYSYSDAKTAYDTFNSCVATDTYNLEDTSNFNSTDCYLTFYGSMDGRIPYTHWQLEAASDDSSSSYFPKSNNASDAFDRMNNVVNIFHYDLAHYADDYDTKNDTVTGYYSDYLVADEKYNTDVAATATLKTALDTASTELAKAQASADSAADYSIQAQSSNNLAQSYKLLTCTDLTLDPASYEMASTDTSAAFDLTASVSTDAAETSWFENKFNLKNIMAFSFVEMTNEITITGTIRSYPAQSKWTGTLVFKANGYGTFTDGSTSQNPFEVDKFDASDTTLSFSGGVAGDVVQVYSNNADELENCSTGFTITKAAVVTPAGVTLTESSSATAVTEGGTTDTYTVVLNTAPTADVTIAVTPDAQVSVSPATLTFTSSNWSTAQTVTVSAVSDSVTETTQTGTIKHTASSTDTAYNGLSIASITATVTDPTVAAAVTITESSGSTAVTEGGTTDTYTAVLTKAPTADVTIAISTDTQVTTSPTTLTFTSSNWSTAQTVTVTAVSDSTTESTQTGTIKHTAASSDTTYSGISIASVVATITDAASLSSIDTEVLTDEDCSDDFLDTQGEWFDPIVCRMSEANVVIGKSPQLFMPSDLVTNAEATKMVVRLLLSEEPEDAPDLDPGFVDMDPTVDWFYYDIVNAVDADVVRTRDFGDQFNGNSPIRRGLLAVYIARALNVSDTPSQIYDDVPNSRFDAYAIDYFSGIKVDLNYDGTDDKVAVLSGYTDGTFGPDNFITRAEAAAMVYRAYLSTL